MFSRVQFSRVQFSRSIKLVFRLTVTVNDEHFVDSGLRKFLNLAILELSSP